MSQDLKSFRSHLDFQDCARTPTDTLEELNWFNYAFKIKLEHKLTKEVNDSRELLPISLF